MPWPNGVSTRIIGRTTDAKSTWPQGCGMYQAATRSGAVVFSGLATVAVAPGCARWSAARESPVGAGIAGASDGSLPYTPAVGDQISLSGLSAEIDRAPNRPHPPSGCVQRI